MSASYCTFRVADLHLGIEITRVQEILQAQSMTRVPTAHPVVAGLLNLRGRVVPALDLRRRLDLPARDDGGSSVNVVMRTADGELSFLVDAIGEVVAVEAEAVEPLPRTLRGTVRELVTGAYDLGDQLLLLLDSEAAIQLPEALRAHGRAPAVAVPSHTR